MYLRRNEKKKNMRGYKPALNWMQQRNHKEKNDYAGAISWLKKLLSSFSIFLLCDPTDLGLTLDFGSRLWS